MRIPKQIGYKKTPQIAYKKIDLLINQIISGENKPEITTSQVKPKNNFQKWKMPEESQGYIHAKENDPL